MQHIRTRKACTGNALVSVHQHMCFRSMRRCALRANMPAGLRRQPAGSRTATTTAAKPSMVLESQPMLSDLVTPITGPWETIAWKAVLDIALPIACLWLLLRLVDWAADQARTTIDARVQAGESDVVDELKRQGTLWGLVLLALRTPAKFMLPPWLFAYTLRTALNIVDLVVNKYRPRMPPLLDSTIKQVSAQLVPFDAALQTLLSISGVLFATWFIIELKSIIIREVILVRAIRSGNKELERVYLPLSSLATWAAMLACCLSILTSLGFNLKPLLAVGGAGGIAAGFASQQLLLNVVAGVNIFLTRPFIGGDQVVFEGGANIEGTVVGVQMTRTLLRTADGTLVALPNKLISDLVVYNRTRALESGSSFPTEAGAAPLHRVLCFTLQLSRELEPQLGEIRADVQALLNTITKAQLLQRGLTPEPSSSSSDDEEGEKKAEESRAAAAAGSSGNGSSSSSGSSGGWASSGSEGPGDSGVAPAAAAAAAAAASYSDPFIQQAVLEAVGVPEQEERSTTPEPQPLPVSITLKQLTESTISLFVRCEMLLPESGQVDAVERQTESTLIAISALVKEKYGAVLLW